MNKSIIEKVYLRDAGKCVLSRFYKGDRCKKCGKNITIKNKSKICRSCKMIGNNYSEGNICSDSTKQKIRITKIDNKNPQWKGDNVGMVGLHRWVKRRLKKPKLCECCKKTKPFDLANKGVYNRGLENWEWLCRKCHMTKDGRFKNLKQFQNGKSIHNKKCVVQR